MPASVAVLGVRHHGPGSARAVRRALDTLRPDLVVIEGAVELDALVPHAGAEDLVPPVAALVYAVEDPSRATFYPLAAFSPEWIALRWAVAHDVAVRFADLPATHGLAPDATGRLRTRTSPTDPIAVLAEAAGFDDPERWWEDAVEHLGHGSAPSTSPAGGDSGGGDDHDDEIAAALRPFDAIRHAMAEVRRADEAAGRVDAENERREAAMRRVLRAEIPNRTRIAVVCGAWHAPALVPESFPTKSADLQTLKGLPKIKVAATWVPWTSRRLARASGYGAGVTSPGWYAHLFDAPDDVITSWLVRVARTLRDEGLPASPAAVVEAVRLADALASLRGRSLAGLDEVTEAARTVLCGGSDVPLAVIADRLVVGDDYGHVPDDTPMVPLATDLVKTTKRLRLTRSPIAKVVELDLRSEGGRNRSALFHRLLLLDIPWATPTDTGRTMGTFKEPWTLTWEPELEVRLIEASIWGTTIPDATVAAVAARTFDADLGELARLVERCLPADLPEALPVVMDALAERAAHQHDTARLMQAVEPLARTVRYGDVRRRDTGPVREVLDGIVTRVCVGLPAAVSSLDDDAADELRTRIERVHAGIALLDEPEVRARWLDAVAVVARRDDIHGLIAGRANRLVLDAGREPRDEVAKRMSRALSAGTEATTGAAWIEGFLTGDMALLLHDRELLAVVDGWVAAIGPERFDDVLPLLRRTFAAYEPGERRLLGEHLRHLAAGRTAAPDQEDDAMDRALADRVLPRVFELLGVGPGSDGPGQPPAVAGGTEPTPAG